MNPTNWKYFLPRVIHYYFKNFLIFPSKSIRTLFSSFLSERLFSLYFDNYAVFQNVKCLKNMLCFEFFSIRMPEKKEENIICKLTTKFQEKQRYI